MAFLKSVFFLLSFVVLLQLALQVSGQAPLPTPSPLEQEKKGCCIKAIYNFGDSISDTGNLLREGAGAAFAPIASLPYGETTFHEATGRCSDGLLMIDYLASALQLPYVKPYLDKEANFEHGVNFAVAGATALDHSFFEKWNIKLPFTNTSLNVQLEWFKAHLESICSSTTDCAQKLKHALFMVGEIGGNDYNYAFLGGAPVNEVMSIVPGVVQNIVNAAKELVEIGAMQLVIPGNFPIGCMPCYLSLIKSSGPYSYDERKCLKELNAFAMLHNIKLQGGIQELRKAYPHAMFMYADYYRAFLYLLDNASELGFNKTSLLKACCGVGGENNFDANRICGSPGVSACDNPAEYISWDGIHLTQEAYKIMAGELIRGGLTYPSYGLQKKWKC